jgi:hypothetical protein
VLELFEALIDPAKTNQQSSAWPVPVPDDFVGKPYCVFATALLESGGVPIGVLRGEGGPLPYVLSMTPANKDVVLHAGDAVYALGTMDWAAANTGSTAFSVSGGGSNSQSSIHKSQLGQMNPLTTHQEVDDDGAQVEMGSVYKQTGDVENISRSDI